MRKQSIDLMRLICAFFIVIIHNAVDKPFSLNLQAASRFAVPSFLMISGYFIADSEYKKLQKEMKKILKYYLQLEVVYIAAELLLDIIGGNLFRFKTEIIQEVGGFLIGPIIAPHLWYLINLVWIYVMIYTFKKINKMKLLFYISIIFEGAGILISNLSICIFNYQLPLIYTRNFLFHGLFFVLLGMFIKKNNIEKKAVSSKIYLVIGLIFFVLQPIERIAWNNIFSSQPVDCYISTIVSSVSLFLYTLKCNINSKLVESIAFLSSEIYFMHPLIMRLFSTVFRILTHREIDIFKTNAISLLLYCVFIYVLTGAVCYTYRIIGEKNINLCKKESVSY